MYVAALMPIGPGVVWLIATMSVNSLTVSHWCFSTTSCWMSEIMAYPPPKLNIPIFVNVMNNLRNSMMIVFYFIGLMRLIILIGLMRLMMLFF